MLTIPAGSMQAGWNLFKKTNTEIRREGPQTADSDEVNQIRLALQQAFASDTERTNRALWYFGVLMVVLAVVIIGIAGWQIWWKKKKERALGDPMFLVFELNSAHQLSEREKQLMQELSKKNSLPTPLKLFIEPKFLLDAWENETFASSQNEVRLLLSKLFDIRKEGGEMSAVLAGTNSATVGFSSRTQA